MTWINAVRWLTQIKGAPAEGLDNVANAGSQTMAIDIIILLAAWIASFGLLGVVVAWHAQAEAAQDKIASEWALSRPITHVGG